MIAKVVLAVETVGGVSLLVLIYNIIAGFIISSPGCTAGLGRVRFVTTTWGWVVLAPMHGCARGQCHMGSQCDYEAVCSKGDDYLC